MKGYSCGGHPAQIHFFAIDGKTVLCDLKPPYTDPGGVDVR